MIENTIRLIEAPIEEYSIVYQKNNVLAKRLALLLSAHIKGVLCAELNVCEDTEGENECEILVGNTCRTVPAMTEDGYTVCATKHKLFVVFGSALSYEYALDFLKKKIFAVDARELVNGDIFSSRLADIIDIARRPVLVKSGEVRVMTNNIFGAYKSLEERMMLLKKVYDVYAPDIICLQESGPRARRTEVTLMSELWRAGYREVRFEGVLNNNYNPVLYRADRFELVDSGYHLFSGANNFDSKSLSYAVLFDRKYNRKIGAYSHHYYYTGDDVGKQTRLLNAKETWEVIDAAYKKHGCPFIGSGDINCVRDSEPYEALVHSGFTDTFDIAPVKMEIGTCHDEADVNEALGILDPIYDVVRDSDSYKKSVIDFLFDYGERMNVVNHGIIADEAMLAGTDHAAVYADLCYL